MALDSTGHRNDLIKTKSKQSQYSNRSKDDVSFIEPQKGENQLDKTILTEKQNIMEQFSSQIISPTMPEKLSTTENLRNSDLKCNCKEYYEARNEAKLKMFAEDLDKIMSEKEENLREEYERLLDKRVESMQDRYNFILKNEQVRTYCMLREAHRERQEKICALQSQLQCKNLSALMYVMCTERNQNKLERRKIIEDYTNYIRELQDILAEGQKLILNLSRGYKTAARVDYEWRQKMKLVISEFMKFINDFAGGSPDTNQFFFDLEQLMKTDTSVIDDTEEDPCDIEAEEEKIEVIHQEWYEKLSGDCRPFVVYGDMADFKPALRRQVINHAKAEKTAPKKWKEYVFKDMHLQRSCYNAKVPNGVNKNKTLPSKFSCHEVQTEKPVSKQSLINRRGTAISVDMRGQMSSLLKIITSSYVSPHQAKTTLLGARDSIEINSATKVREKSRMFDEKNRKSDDKEVVLDIRKNRTSIFNSPPEDEDVESPSQLHQDDYDDDRTSDSNTLGSMHTDSLVVGPREPDIDHTIDYEKVCPMEKCQRMRVDSFIRSLPPYMRASPFTCFDQSFEEYHLCSPEQLEILRQRMDQKEKVEESSTITDYTLELDVHGVTTQTSASLLDLLPLCNCPVDPPSSEPSNFVFDVHDLIPVKQTVDTIKKEYLYDERIEFNRFKVLGQTSSHHIKNPTPREEPNFQHRFQEIKRVLKIHPSLLEIFQANSR